MSKIIHPCNIIERGQSIPVFCKIEYSNGRLSISGVIGPQRGGNAIGGCGQIDMEFDHKNPSHNDKRYSNPIKAESLQFTAGWNAEMWLTFLDYWKHYHLNDMHSECEHQEALGWTYENHHGVWLPDESIQTVDEYDTGELPMKFHPYLGEACPECGYRIGSAWTFREVPDSVIAFLNEIPHTDVTPAWV